MRVLLSGLVTVLLVQFATSEVLLVGDGVIDNPTSCVQTTDKNAYKRNDFEEYTAETESYSEKTDRTTCSKLTSL